jgi:hypothetical protein
MVPPVVVERPNRFQPHFASPVLTFESTIQGKAEASRNDSSAADTAAATVKRKCWLDFRVRDSNLVGRQACRQKNFQKKN